MTESKKQKPKRHCADCDKEISSAMYKRNEGRCNQCLEDRYI